MDWQNYIEVTKFNKYFLFFDKTTNSLVLKKEYQLNQKELIVKLQGLNKECKVANIIEVEETQDKIITIEEFIQGITLSEYLEQRKFTKEKISKRFFKIFLENMYDTLLNLKDKKIVHKDIKGSNIIINEEKFYLIDFGISRIHKENINKDTSLFGTEGYAAPEQYGFSQTTFKSDIFSLGKVLEDIYMLMDEDKEIEALISEMTRIDYNKRLSLEGIGKYLNKGEGVHKKKFSDYLPIYKIFQNTLLNVLYNLFVVYFIIYMDISYINDTSLKIGNEYIVLIGLVTLVLFNLLHKELKKFSIYQKYNNASTIKKVLFFSIYVFVLYMLFYLLYEIFLEVLVFIL